MPRARRAVRRLGVRALVLTSALLMVPIAGVAGVAAAQPTGGAPAVPSVTSADGSKIVSIKDRGKQGLRVTVHSTAMDRDIPLAVLRPADTSKPAPTLYLLNGGGGGEDRASWGDQTDYIGFFADKHVNVVTPLAGKWTYYTDWVNTDPTLGKNKWTTFLTQEVPPLIDAALDTTRVNAIAGLSTSGTSVFNLAIAAPGLYKGIGAYSGCAQTSDPVGQELVKTVVDVWGNSDVTNMWGPLNGPMWAANDPFVQADKLRGYSIYVSTGNGLPGPHDTLENPALKGSVPTLANQMIVGGAIEAATNQCSHNLAGRLGQLGIPATFNFKPTGTHSWGYWEDDLHDSWPILAQSMGI
ncbi:esterase family protein [Aldersonia sp. NBC_00410]|uniref:alpha/beta hydrolase n=1 Tax=Aldersonia sp. NBC_00410 TaxID=2975954 RepID=UPI0022549BFD|nr:alpha/beta hydrolase family protein [Aldersonia sp. NBC_00410]MCX5044948.1 esterase family protein [Aldersonia sp. NBC_00410]